MSDFTRLFKKPSQKQPGWWSRLRAEYRKLDNQLERRYKHWKLGWKVKLWRVWRYFRSKKQRSATGNPALSQQAAMTKNKSKRIKRFGIIFLILAMLLVIGAIKLAARLSTGLPIGKIGLALLATILIYFLVKTVFKRKENNKKRLPVLAMLVTTAILLLAWWGVDKYKERNSPDYLRAQLVKAQHEVDSLRAITTVLKTDTIKVMASKFGSQLVRIPFGYGAHIVPRRNESYGMSFKLPNGTDTVVTRLKNSGHKALPDMKEFQLLSVDSNSLPFIVEIYPRR